MAFRASHSVSCFGCIFPNLFSWSTTYWALKIFHIFSPKPKKSKVNKLSMCFSKFFRSICVMQACFFKPSYPFFLFFVRRSPFSSNKKVSLRLIKHISELEYIKNYFLLKFWLKLNFCIVFLNMKMFTATTTNICFKNKKMIT
jgi:hypothetical protein